MELSCMNLTKADESTSDLGVLGMLVNYAEESTLDLGVIGYS